MAESGLGGGLVQSSSCWCRRPQGHIQASVGETPWTLMYGAPKDVSQFRAFGCRAFVHLNPDRREKGKHTALALKAVCLGFEPNTSTWSFYIPE